MTELRKRLKTISFRNEGLQRVLRTCAGAVDVISVEEHVGGIHNTKVIFLMENGEHRVQFYDRVDIKLAVPEGYVTSGSVATDVTILNSAFGGDFTEDDLILVDGKLKAKPESLGYRNDEAVTPPTNVLPGDSVSFHLMMNSSDYMNNWWPRVEIRVQKIDAEGYVDDDEVVTVGDSPRGDQPWYKGALEVIQNSFNIGELKDWVTVTVATHPSKVNMDVRDNYFITLTNKRDFPIEVAVLAPLSVDGRIEVEILLNNTRLQPKGAPATYSAVSDTKHIKTSDFVNFANGLYSEVGGYRPEDLYTGELLSINGGTSNTLWSDTLLNSGNFGNNTTFLSNSISPYIEGPRGSQIRQLVRLFINEEIYDEQSLIDGVGEEGYDPEFQVDKHIIAIFKNMSPTPISIKHAAFTQPINLLPYQDLSHPDEVLYILHEENGGYGSIGFFGGIHVTLDDETFVSLRLDMSRGWRSGIYDLLTENPEIQDKIHLCVMRDVQSHSLYLYAKNKTSEPVSFELRTDDEMSQRIGFVLAPAGTPGRDKSVVIGNFTDLMDEVKIVEAMGITDLSTIEDAKVLYRGNAATSGGYFTASMMVYPSVVGGPMPFTWPPSPFRESITFDVHLTDGTIKTGDVDLGMDYFPQEWTMMANT